MQYRYLNDVVKEYPDMYLLTIFKFPLDLEKRSILREKNKTILSSESSIERSVRRTRRLLFDYVACNNFDLFVTFTFNPKKVDRYDLNSVYTKMQGWLFRQREKSRSFKYLIVPERHKDGAIHFHALVENSPFSLKKTKVIQNNNRVYNVTSFRYGFTNAQYLPVDDKQKVGAYIAKYITKDMQKIHNRRRYWCSKNLLLPKKYYNKMNDLELCDGVQPQNIIHASDFNITYQIQKRLFD